MKKALAVLIVCLGALAVAWIYFDRPVQQVPNPDWVASVSRADIARRQIMVDSGGTFLEAEILVPTGGAGRKPALVFTPGSNDSMVQNYSKGFLETFLQDVFLPRDFVLVYVNKRGLGASGGSWLNNTIEGRADDVYAVVEAVRELDMIDPERVGVAGHSQGGWVVNHMVAAHPDLAFFIDFMGPVRSPWEQFLNMWSGLYGCDGLSGDEMDAAMLWKSRITRYANAVGRVLPIGQIGFDARFFRYDPTDAVRSIAVPGLFVFAQRDILVNQAANVARLNQLYDGETPAHLTVLELPAAAHDGFLTDSLCAGFYGENQGVPSPELVAGLVDFLTSHGY